MDPDGHDVNATKPARGITTPSLHFPRYSRYKRILELTGYVYSIGLFALACVLAVQYHFGSMSVLSPIETATAAEPPVSATAGGGTVNSSGSTRGPAAIAPKTQAP